MAVLVVILFVAICLFFNLLGVVSLFRFPDVYTRLHGATKCTTFGTLFAAFAVIAHSVARYFATGEVRFLVLIIHTLVAAGARVRNAYATCPHQGNSPPKGGLMPHRPRAPHGAMGKALADGDGHACH